jgi:hypothetical protein
MTEPRRESFTLRADVSGSVILNAVKDLKPKFG